MTKKKKDQEGGLDAESLVLIKQMLISAEKSIQAASKLIFDHVQIPETAKGTTKVLHEKAKKLQVLEEGRVIEGIFDGQNMIGPDDKQYPVPPNYASKSKLIEGDILKLTIGDDGSFIFKQIGPIERKKMIGVMMKEDMGYRVVSGDVSYKVLMASVTYFKAEPGDEVTVIVPKNKKSTWAAIENVIKKIPGASASVALAPEETIEEEKEPVHVVPSANDEETVSEEAASEETEPADKNQEA